MAETEGGRNWAELPSDILSLIYKKLGVIEVLWTAQAVCHSWRELTFDPSVWRCIDLRSDFEVTFKAIDMLKVVLEAVIRSAGNVEKLYLGSYTTDALFSSIVDRTPGLKCLLLEEVQISQKALVKFVGRCPLLEELQINKCSFFPGVVRHIGRAYDVFRYIGRACPELKCFCLNDTRAIYSDSDKYANDDEALEIAKNMPNLRELQLIGNLMTNTGLNSILEKCLHLESLDIRECPYIDLTEEMRAKLAKINTVRLPSGDDDFMRRYRFPDRYADDLDDYSDSDYGYDYYDGDLDDSSDYLYYFS